MDCFEILLSNSDFIVNQKANEYYNILKSSDTQVISQLSVEPNDKIYLNLTQYKPLHKNDNFCIYMVNEEKHEQLEGTAFLIKTIIIVSISDCFMFRNIDLQLAVPKVNS